MFIPRGTALHENLATSYVLVDGLVTDLCEGGFSGVVEILLRNADAHIVIARGSVVAAIESRNAEGDNTNPVARAYARVTVADLAAKSRSERGRVSIYSYDTETANVIAALINATPLYTGLSTEFADLEKMISKLSRERDRQWFIEVLTERGLAALIRIRDEGCLVLTSQEGGPLSESETPDLKGNLALRSLLDECNQAGGVFDVYFESAASGKTPPESDELQSGSLVAQAAALQSAESDAGVSQAVMEAKAVFESLSVDTEAKEIATMSAAATASEKSSPPFDPGALARSAGSRDEQSNASDEKRMPAAGDLLLVQDDLRATGLLKRGSEPDRMAEVKRLMGEMAKTIEEAIQSAEPRDNFSMHLRAGQLKIAERYPFLDPFGAEFEYLAGEIVFVGYASPGEFIEGLTEALKFAVEAAVKSSAQPARLRARIADELEWLLKRQKTELEQHGLDQSIVGLINAIAQG